MDILYETHALMNSKLLGITCWFASWIGFNGGCNGGWMDCIAPGSEGVSDGALCLNGTFCVYGYFVLGIALDYDG